ncbi:MAG: DUF1592 domain-containing protein [Bdellovibrionales bacterium]|nr:DUF1592 domain-containing protein [Oligoflexia bacterium]
MKKRTIYSLASASICLVLLSLFINCTSNFETVTDSANFSSSASAAPGLDVVVNLKGEKLYQTHCFGCHGSLDSSTKLGKSPQQITDALRLMPQMQSLRQLLSAEDIQNISQVLAPGACAAVPVGRTALQRLNKAEFSNSIRSIFGITGKFGDSLPQEALYNEFSNLSDTQSINLELTQAYLSVASTAVESAFATAKANIFVCPEQNDACARTILARMAEKAYRRPPTTADLDQLMKFMAVATSQGEGFEAGIKLALQGLLVSPKYIFRFIQSGSINSSSTIADLNPLEIATRLAYFIWSAPPDATLLTLAKSGELKNASVLQTQVIRMLKDPKAQALVDQFAMQWLNLSTLSVNNLSRPNFPIYDNALKNDMIEETKQMFSNILTNDLSPVELFNANYSFVNQRLADLYGIPGVTGTEFRKVYFPSGANRKGILTQASVMLMTSNASETSLIHRGVWMLDSILCDMPAPPPANITQSETLSEAEKSNNRLINPNCAKCHTAIDNIGIGFEKFNPIGQLRNADSLGKPILTSGTVIGFGTYNSSVQLVDFLASDPRVPYCFTKKLMTFATGRTFTAAQRCAVRQMGQKVVHKDSRFSDVVLAIVQSDFFQKQQGGN